jgi:prephenate dehydrogenase
MGRVEGVRDLLFDLHLFRGVATTQAAEPPDIYHAAGPGLFDSTRLALSPWGVWADILATNGGTIEIALAALAAHIERLREELKRNGDLQHYFDAGRQFAEDLRKNKL